MPPLVKKNEPVTIECSLSELSSVEKRNLAEEASLPSGISTNHHRDVNYVIINLNISCCIDNVPSTYNE